MVKKLQQSFLPFKIERTDEPLIARAGLVLPLTGTIFFAKEQDKSRRQVNSATGANFSDIRFSIADFGMRLTLDKGGYL